VVLVGAKDMVVVEALEDIEHLQHHYYLEVYIQQQ
jgi:hypothetical protein